MVNQKIGLSFVHRVVQDQEGRSPDVLNVQNCNRDLTYECLRRRSSKCKKVVQHGVTWTTTQYLEIFRINLYSKAYNSDHVLLFLSGSEILILKWE